ncbi:MAG: uroporphyrin-III C-methyltransferase [Crenarchaeota archaeon]|nr:uroporphyrin-III C-methyltransferase [Thermoproteota archaeon]
MPGQVYIIGVGPGAPDLLTLRAIDRLSRAEVVVYGNLVPDIIVEKYAKNAIEKIKVVKKHRKDALKIVIEKALQGYTVAHLKNGDPTIFAHFREEIEELKKHGIKYEIIPGVSSITAAAAEAEIALTDFSRGIRGFAVVDGHDEDVETMIELVDKLGMVIVLMPSLEKIRIIKMLRPDIELKVIRNATLNTEVLDEVPEKYDGPCIIYLYKRT